MTDAPTTTRTHTFSWEDPMIGAKAARNLSGLELLQAIGRGEIPPPPFMAALGITAVDVEAGRIVFALEPAEYHYNPIGSVHGGVTATICDSAMGCAIHSTLPAGVAYTTLEIKVNYVRPITIASGRLQCEGKIIAVGSRVATAEARLTDGDGKLYAHATTTCIVLR
ncbi:MAG: PaaI family thioesterase [Chloroflexaceae bacterium]|jgi:uncharacterized protein (TIGR00369 family)|nr:PaaI family thioesterase [Chloroflexaceae bacterium]